MITKIKWKNHNILGKLELDFTKKDGTPYNTVIIAGENGCGKTKILSSLAAALSEKYFDNFDYIEYVTSSGKKESYPTKLDYGESISLQSSNPKKDGFRSDGSADDNDFDINTCGVAYAKARSELVEIFYNSIAKNELDSEKISMDSDDTTKIVQFLIDISEHDNFDLKKLLDENNDDVKGNSISLEEKIKSFKENARLYRFEQAFNNFFENIKFKNIVNSSDKKKILFIKFSKDISIDELSLGEKQIVFRGSYLLKNQKILDGGIVLIDEPELSMHPLWQEKVLGYYRDLFTVEGEQTVQMIVATHSEYVIKSALEDKGNALVISLKNNNGIIEVNKVDTPQVLQTITLAETNYFTFNIISTDYHIQLYGYLQYLTGNDAITSCDNYIANYIINKNKDRNVFIKPSSYTNQNGNTTNYQTLSTYIRNNIDHPDNGNKYTEDELKASIELLIEIIKDCKISIDVTTTT